MKKLLLFAALILSAGAVAQQAKTNQPLEVLMIGASHDYGKNLVEQFNYPLDKALAFRPDAVVSEDLSADDFNALTDYWNMATVKKRLAYLQSVEYPAPKNPDAFIRDTYKLLREHPNYHQDRMKLARALYLKHDFGNARYQFYRLDKAKGTFGDEERAAYQAILGVPDSLYRSRSSEYHNIFFPIMDKLQQDRLIPMDCQKYDLQWQAAWEGADSLFHKWETGVEKDSTSADARRYAALMKRTDDLGKRVKEAHQARKETEFLNSPEGDEFLNIVNFYGARRMFGAANFPEKALSKMLHFWQLRNECMCQNLVSRARAAGAKRVVVGVGANHRKIMVDMLKAIPGVTVYTLNEYNP
jgi:hypothetical protein